jgi:molybdopterin-guanine dinucleotide biosynthesis protein A
MISIKTGLPMKMIGTTGKLPITGAHIGEPSDADYGRMSAKDKIVGCILAGGLSRRMGGGDKTLRVLGGKPMLGHVLDRLAQQVPDMVLNANGEPERLSEFGLPIVPDAIEGFAGPLAGISACLEWTARNRTGATHIVTVAADTPFFPADLANRLMSSAIAAPDGIAMATSDGHRHPVFGVWPVSLRHHLAQWMAQTETYKVIAWARLHGLSMVDFPMIGGDWGSINPFFNVNTPEELSVAETLLGRMNTANA